MKHHSMLRKVRVQDAVGMVLAHDVTRIVPGRFKGVGFRKGHTIGRQDIDALLDLGKSHIYVLELADGWLHEDQAAARLAAAVADKRLQRQGPAEGKISLVAHCDGLLEVDADRLEEINLGRDVIVATLKTGTPCRKGQVVAATRVIPLVVPEAVVTAVETICASSFGPVVRLHPFRPLAVGAVVTGSEVAQGRIEDGFDRQLGDKIRAWGCTLVGKELAPDDPQIIAAKLQDLRQAGAQMLITTGGLSVDPDDVTAEGIARTGADLVVVGSPVLPGAMFVYANWDGIPILGLPACVYYHAVTIFDLVAARIRAGLPVTRRLVARMGHGGLCLQCDTCRFPVCPFGR